MKTAALNNDPEYFDDQLLILVNPDLVTRPTAARPLGLPLEVTRALLGLEAFGAAAIGPIVDSGFEFYRAPSAASGLTAAESGRLTALIQSSLMAGFNLNTGQGGPDPVWTITAGGAGPAQVVASPVAAWTKAPAGSAWVSTTTANVLPNNATYSLTAVVNNAGPAVLSFRALADNRLSVFVNGAAAPVFTFNGVVAGDFRNLPAIVNTVVPGGPTTIRLDVTNVSGFSGLLFTGGITEAPDAASIAALMANPRRRPAGVPGPGEFPMTAAREMASRVTIKFAGPNAEAAAAYLRGVPNIARVERPVRGYGPNWGSAGPRAAGRRPGSREPQPPLKDWWRVSTALPDSFKDAPLANIAVLDSGADRMHEAFLGAGGDSRIEEPGKVHFMADSMDTYGHGTHVCSIIAGKGTDGNPDGVFPNAAILIFNIFAHDDTIDMQALRTALFAIRHYYKRIKAINLSVWMRSRPDQDLLDALRDLEESGVAIVACAGNQFDPASKDRHVHFPARLRGILSVGATQPDSNTAYFSRYSTWGTTGEDGNDSIAWVEERWPLVDVLAPGATIWGAVPVNKRLLPNSTDRTAALRGTSMATPMVTAAAAYLLAQPGWEQAQAVDARRAIRHCTTGDGTGWDEPSGFGALLFSRIEEAGRMPPGDAAAGRTAA